MSERDFKVVFLYRLLTIRRRGVFAKENPLVNLSFLQLQENKRMIFLEMVIVRQRGKRHSISDVSRTPLSGREQQIYI